MAAPTSATWLFSFDADVAADGIAALVELHDGQGAVPVVTDTYLGSLRVSPVQRLKMRTAYTLTVKAGLKSSNGAVMPSELVRRFETISLDGVK